MNIQEVKKVILEGLGNFAEKNGFIVDTEHLGLFSENRARICSIDFIYHFWKPAVEIYPYVNIEFKAIHEICERCGFHLNYTAFINLFMLEGIRKYGWPRGLRMFGGHPLGWHEDLRTHMTNAATDRLTITDDEKIFKHLRKQYPEAKDRIIPCDGKKWIKRSNDRIEALMPYAVEYMETYRDIESIDMLYNSLPIEGNPNCTNIVTHSIIGIIAAKLARNPQYDMVKDAYISNLKRIVTEKEMMPVFLRIVEYLDNNF